MKRLLWAALAVSLIAIPLCADDEHFINIQPGDRAASMGGAYTAISDGPEGAYYNPAGLAFSPNSYVSLSTNAVQFKRQEFLNIFDSIASTRVDYRRDSFSFVPSFFGIIQKDKNGAFALTIASLDNESFDQRDKMDLVINNYAINFNVNYVQTTSNQEIGVAWGLLADRHLSFGFGLFAGYKDRKYINSVTQLGASADFSTSSDYFREQLFSLRPVLGIQWAPLDQFALGLATTLAMPMFGMFTTQGNYFVYLPTDPLHPDLAILDATTTSKDIFTKPFFTGTNLKSSIGVAWLPNSSFILSGDFLAYVPIDPNKTLGQVFTWNAAIGMEWYITPNFPLRAGIFTNNANTPVMSDNVAHQKDHVNLYGLSLATGYTTANFDFTIGISASTSLGDGKAQILDFGSIPAPINQASLSTVQVIISGGYH